MDDVTCVVCGEALEAHPPQINELGLPLYFHIDGHGFVASGEPDPRAERAFAKAERSMRRRSGHGILGKAFAVFGAATAAPAHSKDWANVHPALRAALEGPAREVGAWLNSGHRTWDQQNYLYQGWLARRPGFAPANPPGKSCHEAEPGRGKRPIGALACDMAGDVEALARAVRQHCHRPVGREPWHFQLKVHASAQWTGWGPVGPPGPPSPPPPPPDPFKTGGRTMVWTS